MNETTKNLLQELENVADRADLLPSKPYIAIKGAIRTIRYLVNENDRLEKKYHALIDDIMENLGDICAICKHNASNEDVCTADCSECRANDCACRNCHKNSAWEWRGEE